MVIRIIASVIILLLLTSCNETQVSTPVTSPATATPVNNTEKVVMGQTIYVPIYSSIYYENQTRSLNLAATLSIRNTDLKNPITITAIRYYDTNGKLLQEYINDSLQLPALGSKSFVVERLEEKGGTGANFIVEWTAATTVSEPVVEAVMISAQAGQGISFLSPGRVIKSYPVR
jgi:spore germination protein YaaH